MKITPDVAHYLKRKDNGKYYCRRCGRLQPEMTQPCPRMKRKLARNDS